MAFNIKELSETLKYNYSDISDNRALTNEFMVGDILVELGYNKKRDRSVKRLYGQELDWEVEGTLGITLAVKTLMIDEGFPEDVIKTAMGSAKDKNAEILLVTNGEIIKIFKLKSDKSEYKLLKNIDINKNLDDSGEKIIDAISKNTLDMNYLLELADKESMTSSELRELILNRADELVIIILTTLGLDVDANKTACLDILTSSNTVGVTAAPTASNSGDTSELYEEIAAYREQIQKLTVDLATATNEVSELKVKLTEAENEINNMSGVERKRAQELLGVIEDSEDMDRHYVAVINTELLQFEDIHTFAGRVLQKLYEIKSYLASQFIFNGEIFTLVQPAVRNDLVMNNKTYDLEFGNQSEDEILNKLRITLSHFDDVIFECKKIGRIKSKQTEDTTEESLLDDTDTDENPDIDETDELESVEVIETETPKISLFKKDESNDSIEVIDVPTETFEGYKDTEVIDNDAYDEKFGADSFESASEIFGDTESFEGNTESFSEDASVSVDYNSEETDSFSEEYNDGFDEFNQFENQDSFNLETPDIAAFEANIEFSSEGELGDLEYTEINIPEQNTLNGLIAVNIMQLDQVLWGNNPIDFKTIKYIGNNDFTFNINMNEEDVPHESLLCKSVDALLALEALKDNNAVIKILKTTDFSAINSFLKLYTSEYANCPRLNGTKYAVSGIESINQVASILMDICRGLGFDGGDTFLYFQISTTSQQVMDNYGWSESSVQIRDYTNTSEIRHGDEYMTNSIIKGDMFSNLVVTVNSLKAHQDIIDKALAVKTKYLGNGKILNTEQDVVEVVQDMFIEAYKMNSYINLQSLGKLVGTPYNLVSDNINDVGDTALTIDVGSRELYMARPEEWQVIHVLLKIHTTLFNNNAIAIKTRVNKDAVNFYANEFRTSEPSLALAVRSFVDYIALSYSK